MQMVKEVSAPVEGPRGEVAQTVFPYKQSFSIFVPHRQGEPGTSAIVAKRGMFAYAPIPKNACTSIKILLFEIMNDKPFTDYFDNIHGVFDYKAVDFARFATDRDHFKFAIVRDPLDRFVSAYNNRVLFHQELSEAWLAEKAPDELQALKARRLLFTPDINSFARSLADYIAVSVKIMHHFVPQHLFLQSQPAAFDRIYNIRQLGDLQADFSRRMGRPLALRKVQDSEGLERPATKADLGAAERNHVLSYYARDYETLQYYL